MSLYFILSIDTECDKSPDWSTRYPFQFRNITEGIPLRLQPLLAKYGVVPTYLLSPEIIRDENCREVFLGHPGGIELGTHLHGEYIEPQADFTARGTMSFQADYAPDIEAEKMKNLTVLFEERFGLRPTSFRAGRFGMGPRTLRILDELNYRVDSSVLPLHTIAMKTRSNSFFGAPTTAYFTDLDDYEKENTNAKLLELPMTVHSRFYSKLPRTMRKPMSKFYLADKFLGKVCGRNFVKPRTLRPSSGDPGRALSVAQNYIASQGSPVFLTMMFHSNELTEGTSPYWQTPQEMTTFLAELDRLFEFLTSLGVQFIRMTDAWFIMKDQPLPQPFLYVKG